MELSAYALNVACAAFEGTCAIGQITAVGTVSCTLHLNEESEGHLIDGDSFLMMLASLLRSAHHRTLEPLLRGCERSIRQANVRQCSKRELVILDYFRESQVYYLVYLRPGLVGPLHLCSPIEVP